MAVITISRGSFSGGKLLAECLARRLGYRCVDRDEIVQRAARYGVRQEDLIEALTQPPRLMARLGQEKRAYLTLMQAALREEAARGSLVYHGNAGHLLLRNVPQVLRVRVVAPLSYRLAALKERTAMEGQEAESHIQRMDDLRRKWTRYLYGVDWEDPALYDMVLNLERMEIQEACDVVASAVDQRRLQEGPGFFEAMQDMALASRVEARLVLDPKTAKLSVEVTSYRGVVSIKGRIRTGKLVDHVREVAGAVPGVARTDLELLVPEEDL